MVHINELYPPSMLKPLLPYKVICDNRLKEKEIEEIRKDPGLKLVFAKLLNTPTVARGYKLPRGMGKSRALLSRQTGMDCFDLEPGHIPEIPSKEEPKNIYEELEELFVKRNEHIKVLLTSGISLGKDDIVPLAILDYKNKTSEAVREYELLAMLDCLIPNLSKEGLEHFIDVANNVLKMKDFGDA